MKGEPASRVAEAGAPAPRNSFGRPSRLFPRRFAAVPPRYRETHPMTGLPGQGRAPSVEATGDRAPTPDADVVMRRLASTLAHHVNNALTGVIGYLELSLREASPKSGLHGHLQ